MNLREMAEIYLEGMGKDALDLPLVQLGALFPSVSPSAPSPGQLWLARGAEPGDLPVMVALTKVDEVIRCVMATDQTWLAASDDLIVPSVFSPTGQELLLCLWRDTPIIEESLERLLGYLDHGTFDTLMMLLQNMLTGGHAVRARRSRQLDDGLIRVAWEISPAGDSEQVLSFESGPRIVERDDPRLRVREVISERSSWLERVVV